MLMSKPRPRVYDSGTKPPARNFGGRRHRVVPGHVANMRPHNAEGRARSAEASRKARGEEDVAKKLDQLLGKPELTPISWLYERIE